MNENVKAKWLTKLITTKLQITQINLILCVSLFGLAAVVFNVNELSGLSVGKVLILPIVRLSFDLGFLFAFCLFRWLLS